MNKYLAIILAIVIGMGIGYYIIPKPEKIISISVAPVDSSQIITDARLDYMPIDSAHYLIQKAIIKSTKKKVKWITLIKDSIVIKDSVEIVQIPYFYCDTTFHFHRITSAGIDVKSSVEVGASFFPYTMQYILDGKMRSLDITIPRKVKPDISWLGWKDIAVGTGGYALGLLTVLLLK